MNSRHIMDSKGEMILNLNLEKIWGRKNPCVGIHRKTLHHILLEGIDNIHISLGTTINDIKINSDNIETTLSNGITEKYDLMIRADGLYSKTRELILGNIPLRKVTPQVCRFIIKKPQDINSRSLFISAARQFLIIPINNKEAYCYVNRKSKNFKTFDKHEYIKPFIKFTHPIPKILEEWNPRNCYWDDLEELSPLPEMGKNRVVLIGDAAHGMPPFMAQGGAMALEDAVVISNLLKNKNWDTITSTFSEHRKQRIDWTRLRNQKREKLSKLPFWIAKLGLKKVGEKNWTEDYKPLSKFSND